MNLGLTKTNNLVVTDCDEVLCNISPKWYRRIRENFKLFECHFVDMGDLDDKSVLMRSQYYLNQWLTDGKKLPKELFDKFYELYDENFYDDLALTPMGRGLRALLDTPVIGKIIVLTHTEERNFKSKERFLVRNFPSKSVEIVFLPHEIGKDAFLKQEGVKYDMFVDDRWDFVQDVIRNTDSRGKSFLLPDLGYNRFDPAAAILYNRTNGVEIGRYKAVI